MVHRALLSATAKASFSFDTHALKLGREANLPTTLVPSSEIPLPGDRAESEVFQMKNRKTAWNNRSAYVYVDAMGKKEVLYPGLVDKNTGRVITEEDIRALHAMDDAEVYNNRKNSKPKVQSWEKSALEDWKEKNPGQEVPCRDVLSLDNLLDDEDGGESTEDKGGVIGGASMAAYEAGRAEEAMIERVREVVKEMGEDYWRVYVLYVIKGLTFKEIGRLEGVTKMAISKRYSKIEKEIKVKLL